ncbi:hypothetical protein AK830_g2469 [Neonectria ditissima]|uniref:BZIP domain-containing protein n=1 Tax=Neonectria ditissima TaxID=78410 RepID=A0A0P7BS16_9HYPO|nr:hypothetical protein AK830_g2469 [Neonectria ditissima]
MSKNIFRIFNPGGSKQDPVEKRRGQLRRAQQNYRDRKDKYATSLEKELARTRASEASLMRKVEQLQSTVKAFAGLLSVHAIDIPADIWSEDETDMTSQTVVSTPETSPFSPFHQNQLLARRMKPPVSSPEDLYGVGGNESPSPTPQWGSTSGYQPQPEPLALSNYQYHSVRPTDSWAEVSQASMPYQNLYRRVCDVDLVTFGMEFVLIDEAVVIVGRITTSSKMSWM